jgi:hypothetical protein
MEAISMSKSKYVSVQYQNDNPCDPIYSSREYTYITKLDLKVGDLVYAPTKNGDNIARVANADVPESKIDERIMPLLKEIERLYEPETAKEVQAVSAKDL